MSAPAAPRRPDTARPPAALDPLSRTFGRFLLTGDEAAIEEIVAATRPRLLAVARRIGRRDDAEDTVQTAYLSLLRHRGRPFDAPLVPWLLTAVVRTAYRKKATDRREAVIAQRLAVVADPATRPSDDGGSDLAARVRVAVDRLPSRYRDVVVLHDVQGLSTAETARLLGRPEATIRTRLARARTLVRLRWNPRAAAVVLALPWFLADLGEGAGGAGGSVAVAAGGFMKLSIAVPLVAVALAAGTLLGRTVLAPPASEPPAPDAGSAALRIAELEATVKDLRRRLDDPTRLDGAPKPVAATPPGTATTSPAGAPPPAPPPVTPPDASREAPKGVAVRVPVPGYEKATDGVDWGEIGKNLAAMPALITRLFESWEKTGELDIELAGQVQTHNGPLVRAAGVVAKALKIGNPNLAFTHPAFQVNAIAASLEAAGTPLTDAQIAALSSLARAGADDEAARAARYTSETLAVTKLVDQAAVRDVFFAAMRTHLTPEQRGALGSEEWRGRLQADLFSSGLLWATVAQAMPATDRTALATQATAVFGGQFGLSAGTNPEFATIVGEWAADVPETIFTATPDPRDAKGLFSVDRITDAARKQAALQQRLLDRLRLDDATRAKIRDFGYVLFPSRPLAPK